MSNNCLSVLYKHIIQVKNKNVGLKVGGGNKHTITPPPPPPPPIKILLLLLHCSWCYRPNIIDAVFVIVNKSRLGLKSNVVYIFS